MKVNHPNYGNIAYLLWLRLEEIANLKIQSSRKRTSFILKNRDEKHPVKK